MQLLYLARSLFIMPLGLLDGSLRGITSECIQIINDYCMRGIISIVTALDPGFGMLHARASRRHRHKDKKPPLHEILDMRKGCLEML